MTKTQFELSDERICAGVQLKPNGVCRELILGVLRWSLMQPAARA